MARGDVRGLVKRHPVTSFFVLTYAISWLAWLPAILGYQGGADTALSMIAQFGPALAALAIVCYTGASIRGWARQIVRWRVSPRWYAVAFGLPAALVGQPIRTPPSRKGSGPERGDLLQTGSMRREPDHRRESAKTASPTKRATIRRRLPAVRGSQQAATGRRAGSAERWPTSTRNGSSRSDSPLHV